MCPLLVALALAPKVTVVMIHGAGGGGWEYDFWKPVFQSAGYAVVARDLVPAKGGLAKTKFQDYVDQVVSWVPKSGSVVLVGASMGGPLALRAAEKVHPRAIILVNSVPPKGVAKLKPVPTFPPIVKWANGPLKDTEASMPDSDRKTVLWAWKKWRNESGKVMNEVHQGVKCVRPTCPVLVMMSQKDTDVPPGVSAQVVRWSHGIVYGYAKMSHVGPLLGKTAAAVAKDAVQFVTGVVPPSGGGSIK